MKTILHTKETNKTIIFTVKADLCRMLNISDHTLLNWSKKGTKETKDFIVYFDCEEYKNKSKVRKYSF